MRRWCALGLTRDEALELYHDLSVGAVSPDIAPTPQQPIKLIQAAMGTGKSLAGERLHGAALARFRNENNAPVPVYLEARPPAGGLRDALLSASSDLGNPAIQGVAVVVDDQLGSGSASLLELLDDARYLLELWPQSTFVILSRPLPDDNPPPEVVALPGLSSEETAQLVHRLDGHISYQLPSSLNEAIERPLFAILVAIATRRDANTTPRSTGELLSNLVRYGLGRAAGQEESPLRDALERLSVAILARGGPVPVVEALSPVELAPLVASGLIIHERRTLRFALDVLLEWFASQALVKRRVTPEQLLADERHLERWFFALVMFIAQCSHDDATLFLEPIARTYPSLASEIVLEALARHPHRALFEQDETQPPPYKECGHRLREAMQAWADGFGPLARFVAPIDSQGRVLPIGVVVGRSVFAHAWYGGHENKPPIVQLPSQLVESSPFSQENRLILGEEWRACSWNKVGTSPAWAWGETRRELSRNLVEIVRVKGFPFEGMMRSGPLWKEIAWLTGLWVMDYSRFWMQPLSLDVLEERLAQSSDVDYISRYGKPAFSLTPLREKVAQLRAEGASELVPPYPGFDEYSPNGWWRDPTGKKHRPEPFITVESSWYDNFSDEGLATHVGAIYSAALQGYEQLVRMWLPTLAPHLATSVLLPARLVGIVKHPWHTNSLGASIDWYLEPLPSSDQSRVEVCAWRPKDGNDFRSGEFSASLRRRQLNARPRAARWLMTSSHGSVVSFGDTPALELVYDWLKDDLRHAHWTET